MIKLEVSVNPEFLSITIGSKSSDELVIEQALKKRHELTDFYKKASTTVNPLLLIQLPDQRGNLINKKDDVLKILESKGITEESGKLAVWLSEEKTNNLANIEMNDNEVEVLVFKQAIALGWDCPRAQILVIFRESRSFVFTIQTIGRIMRMPEMKYYDYEELNKGYIFTNLPSIEITEDYAKDYITTYEAKRDNKIYSNVSLASIYLKRQRERTRLSGEFIRIFEKVAEETKLKNKITPSPSIVVSPIIADGKIVNVDQFGEIENRGTIDVRLDEAELQQRFDKFITDNCMPYAPADSSDRMKSAIYQFLNLKFKIERLSYKAQQVVLGKENVQLFVDTINLAKEEYKRNVVQQLSETRETIQILNWEVPLVVSYNSRYARQNLSRSIMKPFYTVNPSNPEVRFIELINNSDKVKWWFKNGESEIKYFAVLRTDGFAFYPDFIVKFVDESIGIFDTKGGMTARDAKTRAEGLQKYIEEQNRMGKRLWGGIVIFKSGSCRYNDNSTYEYDERDLSSWKILEL